MKTWRVVAASTAGFAVLAGFFGYLFMTRPKPELRIATWPGSYGHAQASAQLVPFGNASGTNVLLAIYDGGTADLARQVAAKQYKWDVIDFEYPDVVSACTQGLLEPINADELPPGADGRPAALDFVPGAIGHCWVASVVYSQVIAYAPTAIQPQKAADFFDVAHFPGKRALSAASGKYALEMALLADGVAPQEVYPTLARPDGLKRALAKLESIKADLIWYKGAADAAAMLSDGRAAMALMPNWAVFDADNSPDAHGKLAILWDRQLYEMEAFGIPKGNPKAKAANDFLRFATRSENLGRMASWIPYGPARRSGLAYVVSNPDLKIAMQPYLPTAHMGSAFAVNEAWWRAHGSMVAAAWQGFAGP